MTRYTVIVKDGEFCDRDLRAIAPSVRQSCGHNHLTPSGAAKCRDKLTGWHREGGRLVCSATWYNSVIHEHDGNMDYIADRGLPEAMADEDYDAMLADAWPEDAA